MSCPDWTSLATHRQDRKGTEPAGWSEALAHFDGGCKVCRKAALKADPTLVFRRMPVVPAAVMTEARERAEVDAVRQAVAAMRAASRLESLETRKRSFGGWKRWSAAAALALVGLSIPGDDPRQLRQATAEEAPIFRDGLVTETAEMQAEVDIPVLEGGVDLPDARVYHQSQGDLSVVMVVDESFDI